MTDFEQVYVLYFRDVYRYAFSLCRNESVAEEITQETFYKALTKLDGFEGKCKISVWLCQIAKNTYISMCRKNRLLKQNADMQHFADTADMEEKLYIKETAVSINAVLQKMDEPYKEVFLLRTFGELPFQKIAHPAAGI